VLTTIDSNLVMWLDVQSTIKPISVPRAKKAQKKLLAIVGWMDLQQIAHETWTLNNGLGDIAEIRFAQSLFSDKLVEEFCNLFCEE
jgi:hypothetical protein